MCVCCLLSCPILLRSLQEVDIYLVLGSAKPYVRYDLRSTAERHRMTSLYPLNTVWPAVVLCCRDALLTLVQFVHQDPQVLAAFSALVLYCTGARHYCIRIQDFALPFIELRKVPGSPGLCMDRLPQLGIIHKLAECAVLPIVQVVNKDIKCSSDMNVQ